MKKLLVVLGIFLFSAGCGSSFWKGGSAGAAAGVVGTGAGYELRARQQARALEEDYRAGRISQHDYEVRKDQIGKGSIFY